MSKIRANFISSKNDNKAVEFTSGIVVGGAVTATNFDFNAEVYNVGTGASISNPANNVLALGTNNTEKVRITSAGSVGIGTDNPAAKLDVLHGAIRLSRTATYTSHAEFAITHEGSSDYGSLYFDNSNATGDYVFRTTSSNTERLRITSGGNVSIGGLASPGALLHLRDSDNATQGAAQLKISKGVGTGAPTSTSRANCYIHLGSSEWGSGGNGQYLMGFGYTNGETGTGIPAYIGFKETSTSGYTLGDLIFGTRDNATGTSNATERLRISSGGIVTKPNHPCFMVRNSINGSAFAANSKATWNIITTNNGSHFDDANDRFVCPVTAIYFFSCQMLSMSSTRLFHELRLNGVRVDGTRTESYQASDYQTNTFTAVVSASANDYFEVWLGTNAGYGGVYANFNGYLIG